MNILALLTDTEKTWGNNEHAFFAAIAVSLLEKHTTFSLLEDHTAIHEKLSAFLTAQHTEPQLYKKTSTDQKTPEETREKLVQLCKEQQQVLSCPRIDEHVLLLACLKGLRKEFSPLYKKVLKEILTKQLHKMEQTEHSIHIVGRKKELDDITKILNKSERNSIILVGQSGVGKTTLAQAAQLAVPEKKTMRLFPGNDIFFDQIVSILSSTTKSILFFLDELPTFDMSQVQYLLENGQMIATANETSYKKLLGDFPHITNKCEVIHLDEPTEDDLKHILLDKAEELQTRYEISFEEGCINEASILAKQYIHTTAFPAKGLALLEDAALTAKSQNMVQVTKDLIRVCVSEKTNIPIGSLTELEKKDLASLAQKLQQKVKGQDEAIEKIAGTIQRARLGFKKPNKPIGSFLFVGPSGVGKTELAKALAKEVFGDEEAMVRLDMSEFAEAHMVQRLIGSPPGYIGFEEGGQLTNPIKEKPYSLVLLDEIEKAHPRVFDIFLQVLDDGRLTDGQGKKVDFRNTIIIATSNAGIEDMLDMIQEGKTHQDIEKEIKDILSDYFRLEFINRFDGIVIFNPLTIEALQGIAKIQIEKLQGELTKRNITLTVLPTTIATLAQKAYDPRYGARGLLRLLQDTIENKLAEMIINGQLQDGQRVEF